MNQPTRPPALSLAHSLTRWLTYSTQQTPYREADSSSAGQGNLWHFIEPAGSLPLSQQPTTCPYPEPKQFSPCRPIPLLENPF